MELFFHVSGRLNVILHIQLFHVLFNKKVSDQTKPVKMKDLFVSFNSTNSFCECQNTSTGELYPSSTLSHSER